MLKKIAMILFLAISLLTGVGAVETEAAAGVKDNNVTASYTVGFMPGQDEIGLEIAMAADENATLDGDYRLDLRYDEDPTVVQRDGFSVQGSELVWDPSRENASIHVQYDPFHEGGTGHLYYGAGSDWALVRLVPSHDWRSDVEEVFQPAGIRSREMVLLGEHTVFNTTSYGQEITLVVPDAADAREEPEDVLSSLAFESGLARVGVRNPLHYQFATPAPLNLGGHALGNNLEVRTASDSGLRSNTWGHEYFHTRQDYTPMITRDGDGAQFEAGWLIEAEASFFETLSSYRQGRFHSSRFEGTGRYGFEGFRASLSVGDAYSDVALADESTWSGTQADYDKGGAVLAALDERIRESTAGRRTYLDVTRRLNGLGSVAHTDFVDAVDAVAGRSMDGFMESYVEGDEIPEPPQNQSLYSTGMPEFDVRYSVDLDVENITDVETGEIVTVELVVQNTGEDAGIRPRIELEAPEGWSRQSEGIESAIVSWELEEGVATADVFGPSETVTLEAMYNVQSPGGTVNASVSDWEGNQATDALQVSVTGDEEGGVTGTGNEGNGSGNHSDDTAGGTDGILSLLSSWISGLLK